jgi:ATP-binding cassette subfamily B protein/subfamily B ATP-binding cassette protein MsbA
MKNFRRALADAARYWPRIALALACSSVAAALWGMNIASIIPILEFSLRGESPKAWIDKQIVEYQTRIDSLDQQILAAQTALHQNSNLANQRSLAELQWTRKAASFRLTAAVELQPWLASFVPTDPFRFLLLAVGWLVLASALRLGVQAYANMSVARVSQDVARNIRHRVFDKTLELDRGTFLAQGPSTFGVQIVQVCDMLAGGIQSVFGGAVSEPLRLLACAVGAALISWQLLFISLLFAPLAATAILWLNRRLRSVAQFSLERSHSFHHVMHEALMNMATVQIFSMEDQERNRFREATRMMRRLSLRANFYSNLVSPVTELLSLSALCLAIVVGADMLLHQSQSILGIRLMERPLSATELMVFFSMLLGSTDPIRRLSGVVAGINNGMIAADVIYPILDRRPLVDDPVQPQAPPRPHSQLSLLNVTFGYQANHPVLRDFSLSIPFGQTVAIVGANGTGKSTLVNLLCRFYDPQNGVVTLDGVPLSAMTRKELRSRIAVVTQHTELFNESLFYNIRYGRAGSSEEEVIRASTQARAHEFIDTFPEKYQTVAGPNGMRLSGGQRQRIALARALLRDPEILILDEATSQIDIESERLIHEAIASFKGTRTVLLITHRPSALALADRVIRLSPQGAFEEQSDCREAA